jgi:hypothetical protein
MLRTNVSPRQLVAALVVVAGVALSAPAGAWAGEPDQSQTAPPNGAPVMSGQGWAAQTFTAGIAGRLDQVDLLLRRGGNPGDLTVQIRDTSGRAPGASVLASETIAQASIPDAGFTWRSVAFDPTAPSAAGTQYAIVLFAGTGSGIIDPSNAYLWGANGNNTAGDLYPGGELLSGLAGVSWSPLGADGAFKTYVAPADTTGPSSTATPGPGPVPAGQPLSTVTGTATFKTTAGATVGRVGPVQCWNGRGVRVALNATDNPGGVGVDTLTYSASGAQPTASTTVAASALPVTVTINSPGVTRLTYSAKDRAGNQEQPRSETVLVGPVNWPPFGCSLPTPGSFAIPAHGSVTVTGTATIGGRTFPFTTTIRY